MGYRDEQEPVKLDALRVTSGVGVKTRSPYLVGKRWKKHVPGVIDLRDFGIGCYS